MERIVCFFSINYIIHIQKKSPEKLTVELGLLIDEFKKRLWFNKDDGNDDDDDRIKAILFIGNDHKKSFVSLVELFEM